MERTPRSMFCLVLLLLAVLPDCARGTPCAWGCRDSHSLDYDFNISNNEPWCKVQGQKDGKKFLLYDCGSNKVIFMNLLRDEGKATDYCKVMLSTLKDVGDNIRGLLSDIKREKYPDGAPFTLQVRMTCPCKADGSISGSLEFSLGGERLLAFDSETEEYRADNNSLGERLKKKWENDKNLNKFFRYNLKGDCKELLKCSVPWKKKLGTTAAPITDPAPATTTPTIATASPTKTTDRLETWAIIVIVSVIVTILIIVSIIGYCYRKSCSPVDLQEPQSFQQMQRLAEGGEDTADVMFVSCSP
ncbi:UL16-binding protein 3-like [Myotis yumanensis]|uniref:UL16-binding protein 3-like n=1 Tax=Myotis yumanensis TaxID=159337 RepID=UPI0038D0A396